MKSYRKYTWAGNKIDDEDMNDLHKLKKKTKTPITEMIAEAVKDYLYNSKEEGGEIMVRKSKAINVPERKNIEEKKSNDQIEKYFKKLMRETKTERYKVTMKRVNEFNPENYTLIRDLAKTIRILIMLLYIEICELEKQRDEARQKLMAYEEIS